MPPGVQQTLAPADYVLDAVSEPATCARTGRVWPSTQSGRINTVTVDYTAGYGATAVMCRLRFGIGFCWPL